MSVVCHASISSTISILIISKAKFAIKGTNALVTNKEGKVTLNTRVIIKFRFTTQS